MNNNKIAHLADIHIRFGSRHEEYKIVFKRVIEDLIKVKPRRIVIAGDLFHQKINLSPAAIELATEFLRNLSAIAPVDLILGNHDMNEQDLNQGNTIKPIIDLIENGIILSSDDKVLPVNNNLNKNPIYFYHDSGFYQVDNDLVYGVYSLWDNEILTLDSKVPGKKYVGLYHGPIYGCMSDNGFILKGDNLVRVSTFNNFDIVLLGDIHEHQSFSIDNQESIAYSGSLIQQDIGESIDKGYLVWDLETNTYERRFIPNDYGFSKLTIDKGEIWQERLEDLKFSLNPKKTKVFVEIVDDAENENVEKKSQIKKYIKQKWGCDFIDIQFRKTLKTKVLGLDAEQIDLINEEQWENLLVAYLKENDFKDYESVIELSREVEEELKLKKEYTSHSEWDVVSMTTNNIFSHPATPTFFDFDSMRGIIGIFGLNYSGKSNIIKALIWGLYQQVLGGGVGDNHKVVNMYTGKNSAYVEIIIRIMEQEYKIFRSITVSKKKDGTTKAEYKVDFSYAVEEGGEKIWIQESSDRGVKEKPEIKKMILDAIGTFDNFTKVSLQTQGGKDDYLSLSQQEKNTLLREYNGLTPCDIRYDLVNKKFNQVKSLQKNLGDPSEIEKKIEESENAINDLKNNLENIKKEKIQADKEIDLHNNEILNLVQKLHKLENVSDNNPETIQAVIESNEENLKRLNIEIEIKEDWLKDNFIRDIPAGLENLNEENLNKSISSERNKFQSEKEKYISIQEWLKLNLIKESFSTEESEIQLEKAKEKLLIIKNDLIIAKGKKCPTCGSVTKAADLNKEQECIKKIEQAESFIIEKQKFIQDQKTIEKENQKIIQEQLKLESLKNSLENSKLNIDQFKLKLEQLKNIKFDLVHNQKIKQTNDEINKAKQLRDNCSKIIQEKNIELKNLLDNKDKIKENELLQNRIKSLEESIKGYKLIVFNSDKNITEYVSKITIQEKNIENYTEKLNQIKESINTYNKYSIYLQAVSRDGIPAQILRKKLPIINYKINSILQNIVNFKIELLIKSNGDIIDYYYFNDDKSDALPLSLGSGSQKFIGSVAIRDALHYISCLVKPSFCIIDEGFGTLDDEKSNDIINVFNYLKTKYRNVIIITHKSVIKDGVDWIINVKKNSDGLSQDLLQLNPEAGISQISFS